MSEARPSSLEEMQARLAPLVTREAYERGLALKSRASDIFISPFGKCGTTWLQQIVHTLRTRGDMDFRDISEVVPWLEVSLDLGIDLDAPQRAEPRAYKSHLGWDKIPKPGRYIVSFRDPKDALVSAYRFFEGWFFEPGTISIDDFAEWRFLAEPDRGYWAHLLSWWSARDEPAVLLLSFEEMKLRPREHIERIAALIGIPASEQLLDLAVERTSFDYMSRHKDRFDDAAMRERSERVCGLPPGGDSAKVRRGEVGSHRRELSPACQSRVDAIWAQQIAPATGFTSYEALRAAVANRA
jgi:hypothetical protein